MHKLILEQSLIKLNLYSTYNDSNILNYDHFEEGIHRIYKKMIRHLATDNNDVTIEKLQKVYEDVKSNIEDMEQKISDENNISRLTRQLNLYAKSHIYELLIRELQRSFVNNVCCFFADIEDADEDLDSFEITIDPKLSNEFLLQECKYDLKDLRDFIFTVYKNTDDNRKKICIYKKWYKGYIVIKGLGEFNKSIFKKVIRK